MCQFRSAYKDEKTDREGNIKAGGVMFFHGVVLRFYKNAGYGVKWSIISAAFLETGNYLVSTYNLFFF